MKKQMGFKTINKKLGEKVRTIGVIICKWKKYKIAINYPQSWVSCQILPNGVRMIVKKVVDQRETTWEELLNDLKAVGTKNIIGNTLDWNLVAQEEEH